MNKKITVANPEELRQQAEDLNSQATELESGIVDLQGRVGLLRKKADVYNKMADELEVLDSGFVQVKRRGRPAGSKNKDSVKNAVETPKRRGRPPGVKNKNSVKSVKTAKTAKTAKAESTKRGRPAKVKAVKSDKPKTEKKRGRPPGSKNNKVAEPVVRTYAGGPVLEECIRQLFEQHPKTEKDIKDVLLGVRKLGWKSTAKEPEVQVYQKLLELTHDPAFLTQKRNEEDMSLVFSKVA